LTRRRRGTSSTRPTSSAPRPASRAWATSAATPSARPASTTGT
jgi:hypothetical protein